MHLFAERRQYCLASTTDEVNTMTKLSEELHDKPEALKSLCDNRAREIMKRHKVFNLVYSCNADLLSIIYHQLSTPKSWIFGSPNELTNELRSSLSFVVNALMGLSIPTKFMS